MFGVVPGIEQNTHKIGECVDDRELRQAIAFLARFPGAKIIDVRIPDAPGGDDADENLPSEPVADDDTDI